jgi:multimeric flavodoxin WrbA
MKKVLVIVGSAREGNSRFLANRIKETINQESCEVIILSEYNISYCDGCLSCDETETCHINDGMSLLLAKVNDCEKMILITPARWSLLSGDMKVFIDRLNPYAASKKLSGKMAYGFAIGQSEGDEVESIELALKSMKYFCENAEIVFCGGDVVAGCLQADDLANKVDVVNKCINNACKFINS